MEKNSGRAYSTGADRNLLEGAPRGAATALACFVVCNGYRPESYEEVEKHVKTCEFCQKELRDREEILKKQTYRNAAGWWTPFWRGLDNKQ